MLPPLKLELIVHNSTPMSAKPNPDGKPPHLLLFIYKLCHYSVKSRAGADTLPPMFVELIMVRKQGSPSSSVLLISS